MRFIDYNGSGGLDAQDLTPSIAVENAADSERPEHEAQQKGPETNVGCATIAAIVAIPILIILLAL